MCTMTWFAHDNGYELFFNRDERLSRKQADAPSINSRDGVDYLSPTDADAGGTWIAVNQYGITVCLLNHYQFQQIETYKNWISRGEIVRQFAVFSKLETAAQEFDSMDLDDYRAFRMFMIQPDGQNLLFVWDGHKARIERNVTTPKSSSSVDAKEVKALRKALFADLKLGESQDRQAFFDFHSSHMPTRSKDSVCMHRDDAKTVSFSHVTVLNKNISFAYADGAPCEAKLGDAISIDYVEPSEYTNAQTLQIAALN